MTGEDNTMEKPENSYYIPPAEGPVAKAPEKAEKKLGSEWLGFAYMVVALFVLIAAFQLYFVIQELIRTWISDQYVPVFSACYYLAIIVTGVWLLRDYVRKQ